MIPAISKPRQEDYMSPKTALGLQWAWSQHGLESESKSQNKQIKQKDQL